MKPGQSYNSLKKAESAPNSWFHYDHPEMGRIEVSAHVPKKGSEKGVKIMGVGAPKDLHVDPIKDAGMSPEHMKAVTSLAAHHGPGEHYGK